MDHYIDRCGDQDIPNVKNYSAQHLHKVYPMGEWKSCFDDFGKFIFGY